MKTLVLSLLLACCAIAAPPKAVPLEVVGDTITVVRSFPCKVIAAKGADIYVWQFPDGVKASETADGVLTVTSAPKGTHRVTVTSLTFAYDETTKKWVKSRDTGETAIVVGDVPVPPGPGPDPDPTPPTPKDVPFAGMSGLRVLIVDESEKRSDLPPAQLNIMLGKRVSDYLAAKCAKDAKGEPERRLWDKDWVTTGEPKHWQDAMKRKRDSLPWLLIGNGKDGYEGPLPTTVDGMLALLKKYGGE